jgi:hypothetical protein
MTNEKSSRQPCDPSLSTLPIALYESHGVIFELYEGGQPSHKFVIRWERLRSVTVTRENRDFTVDINQRQHDLSQHDLSP